MKIFSLILMLFCLNLFSAVPVLIKKGKPIIITKYGELLKDDTYILLTLEEAGKCTLALDASMTPIKTRTDGELAGIVAIFVVVTILVTAGTTYMVVK